MPACEDHLQLCRELIPWKADPKKNGQWRGEPGQQHGQKVSGSGDISRITDYCVQTSDVDETGKDTAQRSHGPEEHGQNPDDNLTAGGNGKPKRHRQQQAQPCQSERRRIIQ